MTRVIAIIHHLEPTAGAGELERALGTAFEVNADRQLHEFARAGADGQIVRVERDQVPFGQRLRALVGEHPGAGLIVLGSGSIPLATATDRSAFARAAAGRLSGVSAVLVNNRFSADILAIPAGINLADLPDLGADNAVPRWMETHGIPVTDLRGTWRVQFDLDSLIDVALADPQWPGRHGDLAASDLERMRQSHERIRAVAADPAAELLVAGRTSADALRWLERSTASRTRALIEERGFRTARPDQRPTRTSLGLVLDRDGPESLGRHLAELADAAIIDSRVLMAHRLGRDEAAWPVLEDRLASDLLLHERIRDPWLRALTHSATEAPVPILLGGHTLVGPGLRLALGRRRRRPSRHLGDST